MAWAPKSRRTETISDYRKPEWAKLYNNYQWKQASQAFRIANPLCVECLRNGVTQAAECVDHITPHKGNLELFWNADNWQALCNRCHARKSAGE